MDIVASHEIPSTSLVHPLHSPLPRGALVTECPACLRIVMSREDAMTTEAWSYRSHEYRGCAVAAASFKLESGDWMPEACFWLSVGGDQRRLWVNSFLHCFGAKETTYSSKIEADNCAFRMARALIDKTLPEFDMPSSIMLSTSNGYFARLMKVACRPLSALRRNRDGQYRN